MKYICQYVCTRIYEGKERQKRRENAEENKEENAATQPTSRHGPSTTLTRVVMYSSQGPSRNEGKTGTRQQDNGRAPSWCAPDNASRPHNAILQKEHPPLIPRMPQLYSRVDPALPKQPDSPNAQSPQHVRHGPKNATTSVAQATRAA